MSSALTAGFYSISSAITSPYLALWFDNTQAPTPGKLPFLDLWVSKFWLIYSCSKYLQFREYLTPSAPALLVCWIKPIPILYGDEDWPPFNLQWNFAQKGGKWSIKDLNSGLYFGYNTSKPQVSTPIMAVKNEILWDIVQSDMSGYYQ